MTTAALHDLAPTARELLADSADPRAQLVARALLEHLVLDVDDEPAGWPLPTPAAPPPCPSCGRRFATVHRTGRHPLHGPVDDRCPGSGAPAEDLRVPLPD